MEMRMTETATPHKNAPPPPRKKSPRAPSIPLLDAIDKAGRVLERQGLHEGSIDVVAQHLGYKDSKNGAALTTLASLGYYGLVNRVRDGMLAVSKDVQLYRFAPEESTKRSLLTKWLRTPPVFGELLSKYTTSLPSDVNIKFDLIQGGFSPAKADEVVSVFRKSVDSVGYYDQARTEPPPTAAAEASVDIDDEEDLMAAREPRNAPTERRLPRETPADVDRIPVRLSANRRAWLEVPVPFYEADKKRLIAQIELILTDEEAAPNATGEDRE
jgi:hypothetical protein